MVIVFQEAVAEVATSVVAVVVSIESLQLQPTVFLWAQERCPVKSTKEQNSIVVKI